MDTVIGLIDEASQWLRLKDTDQWARPWPDEESRRQRILDGLRTGTTWIVRDGTVPVATVSMTDEGNPLLWRPDELAERAVYLHRLVISRKYAGHGLGAALLEWAAQEGRREYDATLLRIDVWRDNLDLHAYYRRLGFRPPNGSAEPEIRVDKERWPSGAVFQRRIPDARTYRKNQKIRFTLVENASQAPDAERPMESPRHPSGTRPEPILAMATGMLLTAVNLLPLISRHPGT
ncbi:GNAT family N-acetyltransferase [Thermomonospora echinospora]|uniref:GNAT family N-acetyltransferase n=1 Tax=Thermomonospora echinospora TaxID=1992 RepID=UPI0013574D7C|nr:GNAT family N-acetyltransferase [Thermomonospora echinospora]